MVLEYGLAEKTLDSLREAMNYYHEGDDGKNANQYPSDNPYNSSEKKK